MKVHSKLLAFCLLGSSVGTTAFVSQSPAFSRGRSLASSYEDALSRYTNAPTRTAAPTQAQSQPMQQQQQQRPQSSSNDPYTQSLSSRSNRSAKKNAVDTSAPVKVQGGSLKTWSLQSAAIERVQVVLTTEGRPLDADIDLWHGPDNTPNKMRVYVEDGSKRPFSAVIETPRGPNTVAVRNIGQLEFPLDAYVLPNPTDNALGGPLGDAASGAAPRIIQGGALKTYPFEANIDSVQVLLKTDGRPLNARIELLQGPNNIKQVMELYIEDGQDRPFFAVIETPGSGNVVRIVNTATVEFPLLASVEPYAIGQADQDADVVLGGDGASFGTRDLQWS